jgi:hypothetical protein
MGLALIWVVARAVFAPGSVTYHRVMGAILLYLAIGWTFGGLSARSVLNPGCQAAGRQGQCPCVDRETEVRPRCCSGPFSPF